MTTTLSKTGKIPVPSTPPKGRVIEEISKKIDMMETSWKQELFVAERGRSENAQVYCMGVLHGIRKLKRWLSKKGEKE